VSRHVSWQLSLVVVVGARPSKLLTTQVPPSLPPRLEPLPCLPTSTPRTTMDPDAPTASDAEPSIFRWILGFLMVGACWGLTTPFMRKAAINYTAPARPSLSDPSNSWLKKKVLTIWYAVVGVLSRPAYAVPLLLNVTGSVWFFILIGKAGECAMMQGRLGADNCRTESHGSNHKLPGLHVYRSWRVVGREKGH
jgi:hypothetical protein